MKLEAFRFRHVGPFGNEGVSVDNLVSGLNVIAEHNERGKSSLLAALETVLFLPHTSWRGDAKRLKREDGSPRGQIDFSHEGRRYRLDKQFLAGKSASLSDLQSGQIIAKKREAEETLAEMLGLQRDQKGPSGLLWVRQGDSMSAAQDDGQVASRLESELSTLVGGDRARAYLERTEAELGELHTASGKARKGGPLNVAEESLARLEAELASARKAQRNTRQMGLDLARIQGQIASLESDRDPAVEAQQLADTREALDQARLAQSERARHAAHLGRLEAESERARSRLSKHLEDCETLDKAILEAETLKSNLKALTAQRDEAQTRVDSSFEALAELEEVRETLSLVESLKLVQTRLSNQNAALQTLLENLEQLQTDQAQRTALIAERDTLPNPTQEQLNRLDQLERERGQLAADYQSLSAHLKLDLKPGIVATIDGEAVGSGTLRLDASQALSIEGVGVIRLAAPEIHTLEQKQAELDQKKAALLDDIGAPDRDAATDAFRAREDLDRDIAVLDRQMSLIAPHGHDALLDMKIRLSDEVARLTERLESGPDPDHEEINPERLSRDLSEARGDHQAAQSLLAELDRSVATVQEKLATQSRIIDQAPESASPSKRKSLSADLTAAAATLAEQVQQAKDTLQRADASAQTDPAQLEARLQRLTDTARNRASQLTDLRTQVAALNARRQEVFERRDPDAEVDRLKAQYDSQHEEVQRHKKRADALTLLRDTLREAQSSLQARYTDPVKQELLPLLRMVIDNADVSLNENLGADGLVRDGHSEELDRLSGGTREQIAILTRLAFARMLSRQGHPSPVILDDALVYADDERRARMFDVMHYVTQGLDPLQLLYLSCHARSTAELGGHVLRLQPWPDEG